MDEVKFCSSCGKLTSSCYHYCPWCGKSLEQKADLQDAIDQSMVKLEKIQLEDRISELEKLETCLDQLDQELADFLSKTSTLGKR